MRKIEEILQSRRLNVYSGVGLALFWLLFAYAHLLKFLKSHEWPLLIFCIAETLTIGFFIFRKKPTTVSIIPFDWLIAFVGTFATLFFRPSPWAALPSAKYAILIGAIIQIASIISLNRSFALVAAKRDIKTSWMYSVVRHPIYTSYCFSSTGYLLINTSIENGIVYGITMLSLFLRIFREENHLAADPIYLSYMQKVRFRLLPYIF